MIISLYTIITIAVLLILAIAAPFFSSLSRDIEVEDSNIDEKDLPPVSVVITDHDSSYHLSQVLPLLLEQDYPADYQVVVVIDSGDSESEDVLNMHKDNPHLYFTKMPDTSRYLSRKKLALTLGMRAARHDWVLVTDVHSMPSSKQWLAHMAAHCAEGKNMVLGMSVYSDEAPAYMRFEQLRTALYLLRRAQRSTPFITNMPVIMLRKSEFFEGNGFGGNLEYARAEFEFLVNKFASKGSCAIAIEPEARMEAITPSRKRWLMAHLFTINAMPAFRRKFGFKFLYHFDLAVMHVYNLLTMAGIAIGLCLLPSLDGIVLIASATVLWLVSLSLRLYRYGSTLEYFDNVSAISAVMMELTTSWRDLSHRLSHMMSNKNDFITHKF